VRESSTNIMQFSSHNIIVSVSFIILIHLEESYAFQNVWDWDYNSDRVKLTSIKSLTFYSGRMTTARRSYPIAQVKCVGGNAGCQARVDFIQCYNLGTNYGLDVQWQCRANINRGYSIGRTDVNCEGYHYPMDPYILRGSCGVEYTVDLQKRSEIKGVMDYGSQREIKREMDIGSGVVLLVFMVLIVAVIIAMSLICCSSVGQVDYVEAGTRRRVYHTQPQNYIAPDEVIIVNRPREIHTGNRRYYPNDFSPERGSSHNVSTTGFGGTTRR